MELYREFFKLIGELNNEEVPYAVVGGIAMAFYDIPRFTKDIDIMGRPADLCKYAHVFKKLGYIASAPPWTFNNTNITLHRFVKSGEGDDVIIVDLLIGNESEHEQIISEAVLDDSYVGKVRIANRSDLIRMKRLRNSDQDKVDIRRLQDESNREGHQGN